VVDMDDVRGTRISLDFSPGLSHGLCLALVLAFVWPLSGLLMGLHGLHLLS